MDIGNDQSVAILLATYNGAAFLQAQLDSIAQQTHPHIDIWASDDGSADNTLKILAEAASAWPKGRFEIITRQTAADRNPAAHDKFADGLSYSNANFLSLIRNRNIDAEYYAFCDQDDVWLPGKITSALNWLLGQQRKKPALYCSRTRIISGDDLIGRYSVLFPKKPCFENAIIQNIAAGNTIVMNRAAMGALREHTYEGNFVSHDWWSYLLTTALGGEVFYDNAAHALYRQHGSNLIGENASWKARMARLSLVIEGRFKTWNDINLAGLSSIADKMPEKQREIYDQFRLLRSQDLPGRLQTLAKSGIHRQTLPGQISLFLAALLGKI